MENLQPDNLASFSSVSSATTPTQRTEWAERHVEEFLSLPFFSEFVFRDVRTTERRKQEQVADFLISHRRTGILVEQKCQEDPIVKTGPKLDRWALKKAKEGWSQVRRAFTRSRDFPVWCDHPRISSRVEFRGGLPPIQHGVVALEVFEPVDLHSSAESLPLDHAGVPITYISLNDFLNLAMLLRSIPELMDYLSARRSLPPADLRHIGDERTLFSFYLLNDGSFAGCGGLSDARLAVAAQANRLRDALQRKFEADQYAHLMEHVADELATRNPNYAEGIPESLLAAYDPAAQRQNYLEMQAALADLRLRERAELGRAFHNAIERLAEKDHGFTFRAARFDSMPDWVYVLGAAKKVDRAELLSRTMVLLGGAMAFYEKSKCLVLVDRDNSGFEVALSRPGVRPSPAHLEAGQRLFGGLRITSTPLHFLPDG
jgi:hypothetical protein